MTLTWKIISKEGVMDEDRRRLLDTAKIPSKFSSAITNMALLGVRLSKVLNFFNEETKQKRIF